MNMYSNIIELYEYFFPNISQKLIELKNNNYQPAEDSLLQKLKKKMAKMDKKLNSIQFSAQNMIP